MKHTSPLNINFHEIPTDTLPTPTLTPPTKTTYTQNGNYISNPTSPTQQARQPTYRRTATSLSMRRLRNGRARVRLHQPTINVHRQRSDLPSSYQRVRLKQNVKRTQRQATNTHHKAFHIPSHINTLTPTHCVPCPELARTTQCRQTVHRHHPHMHTLQHVPAQTHHATKHGHNNMEGHTQRQHSKPPPRKHNQPLQHSNTTRSIRCLLTILY